MSKKRIIAAFDFDGTITYRDILLPFLIYTNGYFKTFFKLTFLAPAFFFYLIRNLSRQEMKEKVLTNFFKGTSLSIIEAKGNAFAHSLTLKNMIRPEMIKQIQWHQSAGHRCILVSANIDVVLTHWYKLYGFETLICSELEIDSSGLITGKLKGLNCWGPEKTRRLELILGPKTNYTLYAYGDSLGDRELLALADYPKV